MGKRKTKTSEVLDVPVAFGGVSIGDATARIGCKASRQDLPLATADDVFCGHRLAGVVALGDRDEEGGQSVMFDDMDINLSGSFDCKRIGVTADELVFGLTFNLADIDVAELAKFSKGNGRLKVETVGELPDGDDE